MNGQGIYTTWTIIASLLNFGHALRYEAKYEMEYVSHVCLGLLIAVIIVYFILENLVLDNYIRLLLTPYLGIYLPTKLQLWFMNMHATQNQIRFKMGYGTIHKRRRQFFWIFDTPLSHVGSFLVLSVGNFDQFMTQSSVKGE